MGFALFSIILTIIVLPLYFLFSANIAGWFVWVAYGLMSVFFFIKSFTEYNSMLRGEPKRMGDVMGIAAYPFVTSIMGVVLIILLFVDISKLHILWLYPVVAIIFEFTIGKRAADITHPNPFKKI